MGSGKQASTRGRTRRAEVTLQDVADAAGVAVSTASRALANPDRVNRLTRDRVRNVARELGYRTDRPGARAAGKRLLALTVNDITNPHNFGLVRGAESAARAAGYTLVVGETRESPELEIEHADRLGSVVDGFVLAASRLADEPLRAIHGRHALALYNREVAGIPSVASDAADGGRQVVEHLAALGHRRIGYLAGPDNAWSSDQRWKGLSAAARRAGVEIVRLGPFLPTRDQGLLAADIGISHGRTALVAFNDLLAIGVLQRLDRLGVDVPGAISVVGYDDIFGADFCRPPLSTVGTEVEQAGRLLVELVLAARDREVIDRVVLPSRLIVRDSTGAAPNGP